MSKTIRKYDRFEYHLEDLECSDCLLNTKTAKGKKSGCGRSVCPFENIRADAIANGHIKRKRGWNK